MSEKLYAGPIPAELDSRLQQRDLQPLPTDAFVKFQVINRGKNPKYNYRWLLYGDGRWFLARHSGVDGNWKEPFDTELPQEPTQTLATAVVAAITGQLQAADFWNQLPYQADPTVEDGSFHVITARMDGHVHEVVYEAISAPLLEFLETIILTYG